MFTDWYNRFGGGGVCVCVGGGGGGGGGVRVAKFIKNNIEYTVRSDLSTCNEHCRICVYWN